MGHHVRGAAQHSGLTRSFARGCVRAARFWLVLFACLAQLWLPAQQGHALGFAAHSMAYGAAPEAPSFTQANFDAGKPGAPCPLHGVHASRHDGSGTPPCHHCPCCPFCPCCCAPIHAAMGGLPQEFARPDYVPFVSRFSAPPAILGSVARFAAHPGQPRAPPVLI
jgi:hypothetical protein